VAGTQEKDPFGEQLIFPQLNFERPRPGAPPEVRRPFFEAAGEQAFHAFARRPGAGQEKSTNVKK